MNWYQQFYSFLRYMRLVRHDTRPIFIYRETIYIVGNNCSNVPGTTYVNHNDNS